MPMIRSIMFFILLALCLTATAPVTRAEDSTTRLQVSIDEGVEGWMGVVWYDPVKKFEYIFKERVRKPSRLQRLKSDIIYFLREDTWAYIIDDISLCGIPCKAHIFSFPLTNQFAYVEFRFANKNAKEKFNKIIECSVKKFGSNYKQRTNYEGAIWDFIIQLPHENKELSPDLVITYDRSWFALHKLRIKYGMK